MRAVEDATRAEVEGRAREGPTEDCTRCAAAAKVATSFLGDSTRVEEEEEEEEEEEAFGCCCCGTWPGGGEWGGEVEGEGVVCLWPGSCSSHSCES